MNSLKVEIQRNRFITTNHIMQPIYLETFATIRGIGNKTLRQATGKL